MIQNVRRNVFGLREPAISTADSHIQNQVKALVEWGIIVQRILPRIGQKRIIYIRGGREFSTLPKRGFILEGKIENLLKREIH